MTDVLIDHIVLDSDGKARIRDRGVKVRVLAEWYNAGSTVQELCESLELTPAQVHAALSYYYDHKAEMDEVTRANKELLKTNGRSLEGFRREIEARQQNKRE